MRATLCRPQPWKTASHRPAIAATLAACGGGGGGNGSNGASAPTGTASTPSANNAIVALLAAPGAGGGSFTATGDVVNDTLAYINRQRAQVGLPALAWLASASLAEGLSLEMSAIVRGRVVGARAVGDRAVMLDLSGELVAVDGVKAGGGDRVVSPVRLGPVT
ncbi:hypothetical protein [Burkholderia pseudomallei]|uniref:hypothetical protein n=1 Tax=Burkholderia pseudomallei TaxID=28450 RepID=UPI0018DB2F77|nr:hypothetical protein [Burkholderia pseudomallei]